MGENVLVAESVKIAESCKVKGVIKTITILTALEAY